MRSAVMLELSEEGTKMCWKQFIKTILLPHTKKKKPTGRIYRCVLELISACMVLTTAEKRSDRM